MTTMAGTQIPSGRAMADAAVRHGAIDLAQGVMHASPPPILLELLNAYAQDHRAHMYTSPYGVEEYRRAIVDLLHEEGTTQASLQHVLGTNGVTGGLMAALITFLKPGDGVLLLEPFYPAHEWAIQAARCTPLYVRHRGDFGPDWESVEAQLPRARAALIGNPVNPSGYVWTNEELRKLFSLSEKHNLLLLFDEVYKDYIWNGPYPSPLGLLPTLDRCVLLRSFSKTLAVSGWRVGYAVAQPQAIEAMVGVHDALYVGAPSLPQWVFARALKEHRETLETFVEDARTLYRQNRDAAAEIFRALEMEPHPPDGTFYMLVQHHRTDDMAAMRELLNRGVAVAPGSPFFAEHTTSSGYIRAHFAISDETLADVRKRLAPR